MKKRSSFFLFIALLGLAIGLGQWFMYQQIFPSLQTNLALAIFLLLPLTFVLPNTAEKHLSPAWTSRLAFIGGYWFIFSYYSVFLLGLCLLLFLANQLLPGTMLWQEYSAPLVLGASIFLLLAIAWGSWNASHPVYRKLCLHTDKPLAGDLRIAFASDLHLGPMLGRNYSKKLAQRINALQPDLVIFGGDLIDGNLEIVLQEGSSRGLQSIEARLTVLISNVSAPVISAIISATICVLPFSILPTA
jgi:Calcineurin-like phosphoesterase.